MTASKLIVVNKKGALGLQMWHDLQPNVLPYFPTKMAKIAILDAHITTSYSEIIPRLECDATCKYYVWERYCWSYVQKGYWNMYTIWRNGLIDWLHGFIGKDVAKEA